MTPAKFLNYHVSIEKDFSNMNRMIPSNFVIRHALILTWILVIEETLADLILQWSEILFRFILSYSSFTGKNFTLPLFTVVIEEIVVSSRSILGLLLVLLFVLLALLLFVCSASRTTRCIDFIIILIWILVGSSVNFSVPLHKVLISAARNSSCRLLWKLWCLCGVERRLRRGMEKWIWVSISECILLWCAHFIYYNNEWWKETNLKDVVFSVI